tara:strand:+ start:329 stop:499 length:171 start_codon:yes stop_codon:yes gene_type:complete
MAKDVNMKKGQSTIRVSEEFVEHYEKMGYQKMDGKKISVEKETEKIINKLTKSKGE